jgi:hypothetical protein
MVFAINPVVGLDAHRGPYCVQGFYRCLHGSISLAATEDLPNDLLHCVVTIDDEIYYLVLQDKPREILKSRLAALTAEKPLV